MIHYPQKPLDHIARLVQDAYWESYEQAKWRRTLAGQVPWWRRADPADIDRWENEGGICAYDGMPGGSSVYGDRIDAWRRKNKLPQQAFPAGFWPDYQVDT